MMNRTVQSLLIILVLCLTMSLLPGHVKRTIDGDTFVLFHVGVPNEERVRVLGVNSPEKNKPNYFEAMAFTSTWLSQGPSELTTCKRDSFGRLLGTVTRGTESLGQRLIDTGLAVEDIRP